MKKANVQNSQIGIRLNAVNNFAGFCKNHWYGYNFVYLVELILKIYVSLQSGIMFRNIVTYGFWHYFRFLPNFNKFEISPDQYFRPYRTSIYLESAFEFTLRIQHWDLLKIVSIHSRHPLIIDKRGPSFLNVFSA